VVLCERRARGQAQRRKGQWRPAGGVAAYWWRRTIGDAGAALLQRGTTHRAGLTREGDWRSCTMHVKELLQVGRGRGESMVSFSALCDFRAVEEG
jgi:hypothetical protein